MRKSSAILLVALVTTLFCSNASAWGTKGHRVIAEMAQRRLAKKHPKVLKEIARLVGSDVRLSTLATCADDFRGYMTERSKGTPNATFPTGCLLTPAEVEKQFPRTGGWHFVNLPVPAPGVVQAPSKALLAEACRENSPCITDQINHFAAQLKDKRLTNKERAIALLFLTHLIGDIHQPLHAVSRNNDQGGNQVFVKIGPDTLRLHSAWDSVLLDSRRTGLRTDEDLITSLSNANLERSVTKNNRSAESWAWESYEIACAKAYDGVAVRPSTLENPIVLADPAYRDQAIPEIRKRIYAASVRLSDTIAFALR